MGDRTCTVDGCERAYKAKGLCTTHYKRVVAHGSTDLPLITREARFWAKVVVGHPLGCWVWVGARHPLGYGNFNAGNYTYEAAHRWAYRHLMGDIPDGLHLDHLCRNPPCVNPDHLEPVTHLENVRRGVTGDVNARRLRRTHCKQGHLIITEPSGYRGCRTCAKMRSRVENPTPPKVGVDGVRDIRIRVAAGEHLRFIAEDHGVHSTTVSRIARRIYRGDVV